MEITNDSHQTLNENGVHKYMHPLWDCKINSAEWQQLLYRFVPNEAPYYFVDEQIAEYLLQQGILVYSHEEFRANFPAFGLTYGAEYQIWDVLVEYRFVVLLGDDPLQAMAENVKIALFQSQCVNKRGHIYEAQWLMEIASRIPALHDEFEQFIAQFSVFVEQHQYVVLTKQAWESLSETAQSLWFTAWLEQRMADEPKSYAFAEVPFFTPLDDVRKDLVLTYNRRIADQNGPNCFATALAMAMGNRVYSAITIHRWLHSEPFLRTLQAIGYEKADGLTWEQRDRYTLQANDVLIWVSSAGQFIHASFVLVDGFLFNKMGQNWYQSWKIIHLDEIYDYAEVISTGGTIEVYRK